MPVGKISRSRHIVRERERKRGGEKERGRKQSQKERKRLKAQIYTNDFISIFFLI